MDYYAIMADMMNKIRERDRVFTDAVDLHSIAKLFGLGIMFGHDQLPCSLIVMTAIMVLLFIPTESGLIQKSLESRTARKMIQAGVKNMFIVDMFPLFHLNSCKEFPIAKLQALSVFPLFVARQIDIV